LLVYEAVEKPVSGLDNIISGVAHAGTDRINPAGAGVCGLFAMPGMLPAWYAGRAPGQREKSALVTRRQIDSPVGNDGFGH